MNFPQYRKKFDSQSFYKITSFTSFEEIQLIGKRFFIHNVLVDKYFEKIQILDMLNISSELYQLSSESEYMEHAINAANYLSSQ
ncbi:MAG: hypothetical protein H3C31_05400 [Brumimicrobium sp.]|nr:hypothetical protein [Brumimicrobium sp.]MCO5268304.1 hypothetical protein [Brumimicrobium sp.]